ncbi:MAG: hypothetical protein CMC96_04380 [Flavobacteriales bacterium]|nr:hypothetical protein [Flavobacteriales bacterium]|tara:strand:- start:3729 stop:4673 length:945 start_codon:yes stop_codon:yes gene_type:complete
MKIADIDEIEVQNFRHLLQFLKRLSNDGVTPIIEKQVKLMLGHSLKFFSHLVMEDSFPEIHRLTINKRIFGENKRVNEIKYLKYPPEDLVTKYGRCNQPKESVLYAAFGIMTVLNELKPRVGDLITKSIWRVKNEQTLKFCPIFLNQPGEDLLNPRTFEINQEFEKLIKDYPTNIKEQILELSKFIADSFSKRITSNNHLDYVFSAYFSSKIFNEFENGSVEAIYYPSVQDKLSFENIAIKPTAFDKKYELVEVKESVITVDPSNGRGGYLMDGLTECKSFDYSSGKILWDKEKIFQPKERLEQLKRDFNLKLE